MDTRYSPTYLLHPYTPEFWLVSSNAIICPLTVAVTSAPGTAIATISMVSPSATLLVPTGLHIDQDISACILVSTLTVCTRLNIILCFCISIWPAQSKHPDFLLYHCFGSVLQRLLLFVPVLSEAPAALSVLTQRYCQILPMLLSDNR